MPSRAITSGTGGGPAPLSCATAMGPGGSGQGMDCGVGKGWAACIPTPTQAAGTPIRQQNPSQHPGATRHSFALHSPPKDSTHKSVKSSRVSSGVNTSSSPMTWGTGRSTTWNRGTAEGTGLQLPRSWHCAPGRKAPTAVLMSSHRPWGLVLSTGRAAQPWHTCP